MPCTYLTADVASIRVNCQIYMTSVMITFSLKQSTLPAVIIIIIFLFVALVSCRLCVHIYIRMLL